MSDILFITLAQIGNIYILNYTYAIKKKTFYMYEVNNANNDYLAEKKSIISRDNAVK